jgi:5-methylcytosine-specific restriction endonuclease McrA
MNIVNAHTLTKGSFTESPAERQVCAHRGLSKRAFFMGIAIMRFCPKCHTETERYANGNCKPCTRATSAAYYAANLEEEKARKAAYRAANAERYNAYSKAYYAANKEKFRAKHAEYYAANKEHYKATIDAWHKANPESVRVYTQNKRARKRESGGKLSKGLVARLFKLQRGKCACCGQLLGTDYHLDHIMPLFLGGSNTDDNIQLLTATCNMQKNAKHPIDFMQQKGYLL